MTFLELIYAHPGETLAFAFVALAGLALFIGGIISIIAAFRGNYDAGHIDETP